MLIDWSHSYWKLPNSKFILELTISQGWVQAMQYWTHPQKTKIDLEVSSDEEPCLPIPDQPADPTEEELAAAAEKLDTMVALLQTNSSIFFSRPRCSPSLCLQAKLTISLVPFHEKMASSFTIAGELWLRGCPEAIDGTFQNLQRALPVRVRQDGKFLDKTQNTKYAAQQIADLIRGWVPTRAADPETQHELTQPKPTCPTCESLVRGCTVY